MAVMTATAIILALKAAHDVARQANDSEDPATLKAAMRDVSHRLSRAMSEAASLHENIIDLRRLADSAARQEIWRFTSDEEKRRYVKMESPGGAFVYVAREQAASPNPSPEYCAGCFEVGTRAMLKPCGVGGIARCPACGAAPRTGR